MSTWLPFFIQPHCFMHLLYLDDAGSAGNKDEEYFVLGGVSVFEAQAYFITRELDGIVHGLAHKQTILPSCMCPACMSRRFSQEQVPCMNPST
jgi:hypothetical protein